MTNFKLNESQQKIVDKANKDSHEAMKNVQYAPKNFVDKMTNQQENVKVLKNLTKEKN